MWYAGIDWASEHHDALVIDEKGRQVGSVRVDHNPEGMMKLNTFLEQIIGTESKEQMACVIETTHGLLIAHLLEAGWPVYPVNPRTSLTDPFLVIYKEQYRIKRGIKGAKWARPS